MQDQNSWPSDIVTEPSNETKSQAKVIKKVLLVDVGEDDQQDGLLPKYILWKAFGNYQLDKLLYNQLQDIIKRENQRNFQNHQN